MWGKSINSRVFLLNLEDLLVGGAFGSTFKVEGETIGTEEYGTEGAGGREHRLKRRKTANPKPPICSNPSRPAVEHKFHPAILVVQARTSIEDSPAQGFSAVVTRPSL